MNRYSLLHTLDGFKDSINCLNCSLDGRYLAVGSDDGYTRMYKLGSQVCILELIGSNPVTCILWIPINDNFGEYTILIGYGDGSVVAHFMDLRGAEQVRI